MTTHLRPAPATPSRDRVHYSGYQLTDRADVLAQLAAAGYPPQFQTVVAEHVTYAYPDPNRAPSVRRVEIVGHACGDGVEAFLVRVDGNTRRPRGGLFHLTYSLAPGRTAKESKTLIRSATVTPLPAPIRVAVTPF